MVSNGVGPQFPVGHKSFSTGGAAVWPLSGVCAARVLDDVVRVEGHVRGERAVAAEETCKTALSHPAAPHATSLPPQLDRLRTVTTIFINQFQSQIGCFVSWTTERRVGE